jgi:rSAM/selenodomain-associated transferase 1
MNHLGVFAKYWQPGTVKTRLGQAIGAEAAARLYRVMLETTLDRVAAQGDRRSIVFSPPERGGAFSALAKTAWQCEPQVSGDLGARMCAFATNSLAAGAERVVLLGTDCPHIPIAWIDDAFEQLTQVDVVLGPSTDGGYYLVGMRHQVPPIFDDIPWSTPDVFSKTVARLANSDFSLAILGETFDVDDVVSLRQLDDFLRLESGDETLEILKAAVAEACLLIDR